jgi:hypothetical protein
MLGPEWLVLLIIVGVVILVATTGSRSARGRRSTAGHYDPNAIGQYKLDPATMAYRHELPTVARPGTPIAPGSGPPHRRRRLRPRPQGPEGA